MDEYDRKEPMMACGRRKPWGYRLYKSGRPRQLFIPGHYEIANGGIDTLSNLDEAYDLICAFHGDGYDVLYEGKNMSDGVTRVLDRIPPHIITIIHVAHPVDDCIASVRQRGHSIQEKTIHSIRRKVENSMQEFHLRGYNTHTLQRGAALDMVRSLLS